MKNIIASLFIIILSITTPAEADDLLDVQPYDRILGDENAPVTIVEYSSLSCPHCASFHNKVLPTIKEQYIDTGKARLIARNYPINAPALRGAMLTMCAPDKKYYAYLKVLFAMQTKWAMSMDHVANLRQIAKVGGMSGEEFDACMNNKEMEELAINIAKEAKERLNIEATPSFFVNGEIIRGGRSVEDFSAIIETHLVKQ